MSHKSDIGICEFQKGEIAVNINGWSICDIAYDEEDLLIKTREDAITIAKGIVTLLEFKYGAVKNDEYPNHVKASPFIDMVDGYEVPAYTMEEFEEKRKEAESEMADFLKIFELMGECE